MTKVNLNLISSILERYKCLFALISSVYMKRKVNQFNSIFALVYLFRPHTYLENIVQIQWKSRCERSSFAKANFTRDIQQENLTRNSLRNKSSSRWYDFFSAATKLFSPKLKVIYVYSLRNEIKVCTRRDEIQTFHTTSSKSQEIYLELPELYLSRLSGGVGGGPHLLLWKV